jgi:hypothetical protein
VEHEKWSRMELKDMSTGVELRGASLVPVVETIPEVSRAVSYRPQT